MSSITIGILIFIVLLFTWGIWTYNRFIEERHEIKEAWGDIDVQLKRRHDLIPNLEEVVKGYADHEQTVLEDVTEKRNRARESTNARETAREESALSDKISTLMAVAEDYPDLKANENFQQLHDSLVEIENDLQYARRYYNGAVRDYNIRCQSFPSLLVAKLTGFEPDDFFEVTLATEREAPDVEME